MFSRLASLIPLLFIYFLLLFHEFCCSGQLWVKPRLSLPVLAGYTLNYWGSVGLATAATYVSHACPCPLLFNFIFQYFALSGPVGLCNEPVLLFHCWGQLWDLRVYLKAVFSCPLLHVNCLPVTEFGPFRRLNAAVTLCSAAFCFGCLFFSSLFS